MIKSFLAFLPLLITIATSCQTKETPSRLNFDFEKIEKGIPVGWDNFGSPDYVVTIDSANTKSGKYAASISFKGETSNFKAWGFTIPNSYPGKKK